MVVVKPRVAGLGVAETAEIAGAPDKMLTVLVAWPTFAVGVALSVAVKMLVTVLTGTDPPTTTLLV